MTKKTLFIGVAGNKGLHSVLQEWGAKAKQEIKTIPIKPSKIPDIQLAVIDLGFASAAQVADRLEQAGIPCLFIAGENQKAEAMARLANDLNEVVFKDPGDAYLDWLAAVMPRLINKTNKRFTAVNKQALFNLISDPVFIQDLQGVFLHANQAACDLTGLSLEQILSQNSELFTLPQERQQAAARFEQLRRNHDLFFTSTLVNAKGHSIPVEVHSRLIDNEQGQNVILSTVRDISQFIEAERLARKSQQRYQLLVETISTGIVVINPDGTFNNCNQAACEIVELSKEVVARRWGERGQTWDVLNEDGSKMSVKQYPTWECMRTQKQVRNIILGIHAQEREEPVWLLLTCTPLQNPENSQMEGVILSFEDIGRMRQSQEILNVALQKKRQSSAETDALLNAAQKVLRGGQLETVLTDILKICRDLLQASPGFISILGENNQDVLLTLSDENHELSGEHYPLREWVYNTRQALVENNFSESQWANLLPAGHLRIQSALLVPMMFNGTVNGILGLGNKAGGFHENDVRLATAFGELCALVLMNASAMKTIQESEAKFRSVTETANDALVAIDENNQVVLWNRAAEMMLGYKTEEILGQSLSNLMSLGTYQKHLQGLSRVQGDASRIALRAVEFSAKHKDGRIIPIELSLSGWQAQGKNFFTAIIRDISERKQAQKLVQEHVERLKILSESATGFVDMAPEENIYSYIAEQILRFLPGGISLVSSFDAESNLLKVCAMHGSSTLIGRVVQLLGRHPMEISFHEIPSMQLQVLLNSKLIRVPGGLYDLLFKSVSQDVCAALEKLANIQSIYVIGFAHHHKLLGSATLLLREENLSLERQGIIETFIYQASVALQRRKAEEALCISEGQYHQLFNEMIDGFALLEIICNKTGAPVDYLYLTVNPAFEHLIGLSAARMVGKTGLEILPNTEAVLIETFGNVALTGKPAYLEYYEQVLGKYLEISAFCPKRGQCATIVVDVTDRRKALDALKHSEERYRSLVENINEAIFNLDGCLCFTYASPRMEVITGYSLEEISGKALEQFIPPENRSLFVEHIEQVTAGWVQPFELQFSHKNGEVCSMLCSLRPNMRNEQLVDLTGILSDLTEQHKIQAALKDSQKLASIGSLTAGVTHEIRSPLHVITGISEDLIDQLDQGTLDVDDFKNQLSIINRNGWRIAGIASSLLNFARAEDGAMDIYDLNEIVRDTLLLIKHQLVTWSNIKVHTDMSPNLPYLECDRNKITQVLINLLVNARDAMPLGGEITISTRFDEEKCQLVMDVADTGHGILPEIAQKIFQPFFTTKVSGQGTGLGLAIVSEIIHSHAGSIEVESRGLHKGTCFTICLPAKQAENCYSVADSD